MDQKTFIIDCPFCRAKVVAIEKGSVLKFSYIGSEEEALELNENIGAKGIKLIIGSCPICKEPLVGRAVGYDYDGSIDTLSDVVRIYPKPPKTFLSLRIPRAVTESLSEADKSLQANANIAACGMFGRALEAVCRNVLGTESIMLGPGVKMLKDKGIIDDRLYDWSQQLHAFRNLAAHPDKSSNSISRQDAEDLQSFVYAIIEYVYDLTDRYNEFKTRIANRP